MQVRPGDQPGYPKDTIESFVGHSSMGLLCPPALNRTNKKFYIYSDVPHTHTRTLDKNWIISVIRNELNPFDA